MGRKSANIGPRVDGRKQVANEQIHQSSIIREIIHDGGSNSCNKSHMCHPCLNGLQGSIIMRPQHWLAHMPHTEKNKVIKSP